MNLGASQVKNINGKESACQGRRLKRWRLGRLVGKIPWSWKWQPTPVFLPGKFHGQRSLVAIVHGVTKSRAWLSMHARMHTHMNVSVGKFSDTEVGPKRWRPPKLHQRPVCPQLPPFFCAAWSALTVDILLQGPETGVISKYNHAPPINQWVRVFEVRVVLSVGRL